LAPDDNFFALGGHSLLGVKLIAAVQETLKPDIELNLSDLLEHPTLADFTAHLESLSASGEETGSI
jgi:acyl carrier protein